MAIVIFTQYLGGATCLTTAQTVFSNVLRGQIKANVPGLNPDLVVNAGARSVRHLVTTEQLRGVLEAYSTAVSRVMYLGAGISVAAFTFSWGLGWKDIRVEHTKLNPANLMEAGAQEKAED